MNPAPQPAGLRLIEIRRNILTHNDQRAAELRARFQAAGVRVVNLVSSPGSGKTALLERTLAELRAGGWRAAALVGDLATARDAARLARSGAPVWQINTDGNCHLEAHMIATHLAAAGWDLGALDLLFIENVGNLVCPAGYDLGEDMRVVMLSVTEGEDKPLKYPAIFQSADLVVLTKIDMAEPAGFDRQAALDAIDAVRPGVRVLETSARTGEGMAAWLAMCLAARPGEAGDGA